MIVTFRKYFPEPVTRKNSPSSLRFFLPPGRLLHLHYRVSIFFSKIAHRSTAATKITTKGQRLCQAKSPSVISAYPHVAGNTFPAITNALGSISLGNMIPESIVDGRNSRMENIDVFAVSFTANPITLAILSDTAIRATSPIIYVPGCTGTFASKTTGAMT